MNNEFYEHKKSDAVKWIIVFVLIGVLFAGMIASLVMSTPDKTEETEGGVNVEAAAGDFEATMHNTEFISLKMSAQAVTAADNSVSKTITATVLPATASNKYVDWTVEWGDEGKSEDVTQYVTVTPSSNGSTTATVTCKKAFTGNILVTATTRENGYQASCVITFVGVPTDILIDTSVAKEGDAYNVGIGTASKFNISLTNPFGSVGSQFNDITCEVSGVGSIVVGYMEHYNQSGTDKWYDESDETITIDSIKDALISVTYSDGVLTVNSIKSIESYCERSQRIDSGRTTAYFNKFRSFVDDCYFQVKITENNSGISKLIDVRFDDEVVTGVSVNATEMKF